MTGGTGDGLYDGWKGNGLFDRMTGHGDADPVSFSRFALTNDTDGIYNKRANRNCMNTNYSPLPADSRDISKARSRAERLNRAIDLLDRKIIEGRNSGPPIPMEDLDWDSLDEVILNTAKAAGRQ